MGSEMCIRDSIGSDPTDEYTVMDIAKGLIYKIKKIKSDSELEQYIEYIEDRPFNDKRYFISNEKLKKLGWTITIPFVDGIIDLIDNH